MPESPPQAPPEATAPASPPPPPPAPRPPQEPSPADQAIARGGEFPGDTGGEIVPREFGGAGAPAVPAIPPPADWSQVRPIPTPAAQEGDGRSRVVSVPRTARPLPPGAEAAMAAADPGAPPGAVAPPPPPPEVERLLARAAQTANVEVNLYALCWRLTGEFIKRAEMTAMDAVAIAEAMWQAGKRTPLEESQPRIALEIYRQVREELRRGESDDALAAIPRALRALLGKG